MTALKALLFILPLTLAAPAPYLNSTSTPTGTAGSVPYLVQTQPSITAVDHAIQQSSFLIPIPEISSSPRVSVPRNSTSVLQPMTDMPSYPFMFSFPIANSSSTSPAFPAPITVTVTKQNPLIIPVPASATTITEIVTKTKVESPSPIPVHAPPPGGHGKDSWASPSQYSDLSTFKVTKYLGPDRNLKIVTGIPAHASARSDSHLSKLSSLSKKGTKKNGGKGSASTNTHGGSPGWSNDTSIIQIFYPKGSINPARAPQGGAEFYSSPINVSNARSVTLEYSVFFPVDFDWVKAGKLPGLYGGHPGCSGGNAALDCFSTRLMWRKDGQGELYLYAPKDKQTKALCDDPQSTCDAAYGLSIGRGSFEWAAGTWTTTRQTLVLNTPGKTDGIFALDVNGERVIDRDDVMYRDRILPSKTATKKPSKTTKTKSPSTTTDDGGLLGPILSGVLGGLGLDGGESSSAKSTPGRVAKKDRREAITEGSMATPASRQGLERQNIVPGPKNTGESPIQTRGAEWSRRGAKAKTSNHGGGHGNEDDDDQIKVVGIFFSTFFGGHEDEYATPKDQYAWFRDFKLSYND